MLGSGTRFCQRCRTRDLGCPRTHARLRRMRRCKTATCSAQVIHQITFMPVPSHLWDRLVEPLEVAFVMESKTDHSHVLTLTGLFVRFLSCVFRQCSRCIAGARSLVDTGLLGPHGAFFSIDTEFRPLCERSDAVSPLVESQRVRTTQTSQSALAIWRFYLLAWSCVWLVPAVGSSESHENSTRAR